MRILVLGAGAIGGFFGARLIEAGADVTFLVRARRAAQLAERGLVVRGAKGDANLPAPKTVQAGGIAGPFDAVLLSCKAYDLEDAIGAIAPAVGPQTKIVPLLNGMRHMDVLDARFGRGAVLGGLVQISATLEPDGTVRQFGDLQALSFGERDGEPGAVARALAEVLAPAGGRLSDQILQEMWEKWGFISSIAGLTCLMRAPIGDVLAAGGEEVSLAIADETAAVAAHCGFPVRPAPLERLRGVMSAKGSVFAASMMRDMERGAPVEADHILGDLISRAAPGSVPMLRLAYLHLKTYEVRRAREAG